MYEFPSDPPRPPQVPPWEFTGLSLLLAVGLAVVLLRPRRTSQAFDAWYWIIPAAILGYGFTVSIPGSNLAAIEWVTACVLMAAGFVVTLMRMSAHAQGKFWITLGILLIGGCAMRVVLSDLAQARTRDVRTQCKNNLKQLSLAMHNYHDLYQAFPPPRLGEMSWRVQMLPYHDNKELFARYNHDSTWNAPANAELMQAFVPVYACQLRWQLVGEEMQGYSDYAIPIGVGGLYENEQSSPNFRDVPDGLSNTIHIVEASGCRIVWNEPRDVNFDELPIGVNLPGSQPGWSDGVISSYHTAGAQISLADGSVRLVSKKMDPQVLKSLLLANDGGPENVEW